MKNTEKRKILIIDNEENFLSSLKITLEQQDYDVVSAIDGAEGIAKAKAEFPDLVICDIMMPKKDGYEVLKELKRDSSRWIPFIMLTALEEFDRIKKAYEEECDFYVTKPIDTRKLLKNVRILLDLGKGVSDK